jgi:tetratricopeptide (TPR) repeat protein
MRETGHVRGAIMPPPAKCTTPGREPRGWRAGTRGLFIGLSFGIAALCLAVPSAAAPGEIGVRARAAFERGERAYEAGQYTEAIQAFREADELAPSPPLSFDIGRCYERSGADREALAAYREYLVRAPEAHNRPDVERRIQALEQRLQADTPSAATPAAVEPRSAPRQSDAGTPEGAGSAAPAARTNEPQKNEAQKTTSVPAASPSEAAAVAPSWWTWGLWGVSAASFAGSGGFELARRHWDQRAHQTSVQLDYARDFATMQRRQTAARVLFGVGAATALGGGFSLYFDLAGAPHSPNTVALGCHGPECWLTAGGQF